MDGSGYTEWKPTARDRLANRAQSIVFLAVRRGTLPELSGLRCTDCGVPAECYDHRNYYEPLKVEPVCKGCNNRRGPGFPYPTEADGHGYKHAVKAPGQKWNGMAGDAEGYIIPELPVHAVVDWREVDDSMDDAADRAINAKSFRFGQRVKAQRNLAKFARYEYFKARDPWALTESFGEFA